MCGIAGGWQKGLVREQLASAMQALSHRGPDGSGIFLQEGHGVGLVHTRLAIIDLSPAGAQPIESDDGQVVMVFNGEIYNYRELAAELQAKGVVFRGHSDTEVLLRLYLAEGMAMLPRLNGMFAFAIYDGRSGDLWLARDAMGIKPVYWYSESEGFCFASEIKGLLPLIADKQVALHVDECSMVRYLSFLWCPGQGTPFREIHMLDPGALIRVRDGKVVEQHQWFVPPLFQTRSKPLSSRCAITAIPGVLDVAVQRQLVSDVPVGAFLSGGLDSSAIVALARRHQPEIQCFTISTAGGRDPGEADDLPYAKRVASYLDVDLQVIEVTAGQMAAGVEKMIYQLDEPLADPAPLNVLFISQLARESGVKVLLSGTGGDDLFTGYRRHLALQYERFWSWLPRTLRKGLQQISTLPDQQSGFGRRLARLFAGADLEGNERLVSYFTWLPYSQTLPLLTQEARDAVGSIRPEQPLLDYLQVIPDSRSRLDKMLALEQRFFLADHNLVYTDKMSMAAGIEVRVPFLDPDVVELAARIPSNVKQRHGEGKWILKKAMEPYLPRDVIYRSKTGFGAPLRRWLKHELRDLLLDTLSEEVLKRRKLFDSVAVHQLIADNEAGRCDASYTLFAMMCVEIWCRVYVDRAYLSEVGALGAG